MSRAQDDFYNHVNKSWLDSNQIPSEYSRWGGFTKLYDDGLKNQIELVKGLFDKESLTTQEAKIAAIWKASNIRFTDWAGGLGNCDPIHKELDMMDDIFKINDRSVSGDEADAVMINRIAEYLHYSQINGICNVFDFDKGSDLTNANNVVLDFSTSGLSLPGREYYIEDNFADKRELFKTHLENVSKMINLGDDFVSNVLETEHELAKYKMKQEQSRDYDKYYTNTTLTDLYTKINDLNSNESKEDNYNESDKNFKLTNLQIDVSCLFFEKLYELFDFRTVLQENYTKNFENNDGEEPTECHQKVEHITAYDGDGIRRTLMFVLNKNNFMKYRSFLQYKIICSFKGYCTKELDDEFFNFYSKQLMGQEIQTPDDKRSIQIVNAYAGEMLGKVYVDNYFPEHCKEDVRQMICRTLAIMKQSISDNDWLTEDTKIKALTKLDNFNYKIGYPDVWKDYSKFDITDNDSLYDISKKAKKWLLDTEFFGKLNTLKDKNEWHMTPQTVNAYFDPTQNEIVFPAAILQPPFYHQTRDTIDFDTGDESNVDLVKAANLGAICVVIAHEITHGYDDQGRKFDADGNLNDWWTPRDICMFTSKTDHMVEQSEKYRFIDNNKEYKLNPQLTMGENLADLGGLSLSLKTMMRDLHDKEMDAAYIRASQRVLFKSYANVWKEKSKPDGMINRMTSDPHSPPDFRTNLVKNMDEFYDAFDVQDTDEMYIPPAKRVRMW
jgi:putative endopeptidase